MRQNGEAFLINGSGGPHVPAGELLVDGEVDPQIDVPPPKPTQK